jgi:ribosomal protein L12E/L44/L45/RPP1/RPP2
MHASEDDDEIVDGPYDVDEADLEDFVLGAVFYKAVLDEDAWRAAERLAELDDVDLDEAVRRAVHAQAKARAQPVD